MSNSYPPRGGRSPEKRAGIFAVILFNVVVFGFSLAEHEITPAFILITHDGNKISVEDFSLSEIRLGDGEGFALLTPDGTAKISSDLNGVRKMEILSVENPKPLPTPITDFFTWPSPVHKPSPSSEEQISNNPCLEWGLQLRVKLKVESYSGEVIQGVGDVNPSYSGTFLGKSFNIPNAKPRTRPTICEIKSIEREPSLLYEWSKRLF